MKRLLALFFMLVMSSAVYAANEWADSSTSYLDGTTTYFNDIDSQLQDHTIEPLERSFVNYKRGCRIAYASAATLTVEDGEIWLSNSAGTILKVRRNTSDTTVTWSDLDTGSEASSTTYYLYAVADSDATTFTVKISASSSSPTGVTYYKRLGSFYNDGSSNITYDDITNDNNDYGKSLGDWTSKSFSTTYQAATDGFVTGFLRGADPSYGSINGYSDSSSPPTTNRCSDAITRSDSVSHYTGWAGVSFPVRRGEYYKVSYDVTGSLTDAGVYFIPLQ